jgi:hypothetical protein
MLFSDTGLADMDDSQKNETAICEKRFLNDIAKVYIYFGSPYIMRFKRTIQTTFTGKISSIGKLFYMLFQLLVLCHIMLFI